MSMSDFETSRRAFLRKLAAGAGGIIVAPSLLTACRTGMSSSGTTGPEAGWARVPGILRSIVAPTFPARDFPITSYGAKGDGTTDCTAAFRSAIGACNAAGGGRVVVPSGGRYLTGAIHLRSNVNLHVQEGARIL